MKRYPVNLPDDFLDRVAQAIRTEDHDAVAIYLFGSYARKEEHSKSDVDIYVVTNDPFPLFRSEERDAAEARFKQLIQDYGLNPSVITFGPLNAFPERIRSVAFEERSVWIEGIPLWKSDYFQSISQHFDDDIAPSNIYLEEAQDSIENAYRYWRRLHHVDELFRPREEDRPAYELAVCKHLALCANRMICWVHEVNGIPSRPKQPLSLKVSRCIDEGWIDALPDEVSESFAILERFLQSKKGPIATLEELQTRFDAERTTECANKVARFLRNNGYDVPIPGQYFARHQQLASASYSTH